MGISMEVSIFEYNGREECMITSTNNFNCKPAVRLDALDDSYLPFLLSSIGPCSMCSSK